MSEWDLARNSGQCHRCESELAEGQTYYGALIEVGEGFERRDFCPACWEGQKTEHFCFWKSRVPIRQKKEKLFVDDTLLINFFERLDQQSDAMRIRFRFVLALILMRKKLLRYEQTIRDGKTEYWQMRLTAANALHQVENPRMNDQQIAEVSSQLGMILRGEALTDPGDFLDDEASADADADTETFDRASERAEQDSDACEAAADQADADNVQREQPTE